MNATQQQFLLSVMGGFLGAFFFSLVSGSMTRSPHGPARQENAPIARQEGVITASEIRLVDSRGRMRAQFGTSGEGTPGFWMYDSNNVVRFTYGLYQDNSSYLGLQDERGQMIELMRSYGPKGSPLLIFKQNGQDRMITGLNPVNEPEPFLMSYENGQKKVHFGSYGGP
jgi:hypothetical protein